MAVSPPAANEGGEKRPPAREELEQRVRSRRPGRARNRSVRPHVPPDPLEPCRIQRTQPHAGSSSSRSGSSTRGSGSGSGSSSTAAVGSSSSSSGSSGPVVAVTAAAAASSSEESGAEARQDGSGSAGTDGAAAAGRSSTPALRVLAAAAGAVLMCGPTAATVSRMKAAVCAGVGRLPIQCRHAQAAVPRSPVLLKPWLKQLPEVGARGHATAVAAEIRRQWPRFACLDVAADEGCFGVQHQEQARRCRPSHQRRKRSSSCVAAAAAAARPAAGLPRGINS